MKNDIEQINEYLRQVIGLPIESIKVIRFNAIVLKFNKSNLKAKTGDVEGRWELRITNCSWRLETKDRVLLGSNEGEEEMEKISEILDHSLILDVEVFPPALELRLTFKDQAMLLVFPIRTRKYTHWSFLTNEGKVLTAGPGNQWSLKDSN